ncbi:hypothetical protein QA649_19695 [Bradyrhizobium sp. CB1717]|uniref:AbiTii domain-containing protein n=1 Tax=Bradyrhizobium sp. CB1717 TaxID=3039154 RepID=UPI0024B12BE8|nr:hypothetical protein [Bradyrhizobium sp. CB1717]WFU28355.1 hypothetical protein QA649_19695 [Bradyrhizobium sp. CB1717]
MPLLSDIQQDILENRPLAPILLKLRFLASRLGSDVLEDWVRFELDGYADETEVPPYRILTVHYTASFIGAFGSQMKNAPVPAYVIQECAGAHWLTISERQSVPAIENLLSRVDESGGQLHIDASNLILLLQGKMYPGMNCVSVHGKISSPSVVALLAAVRSRILELTIQLEKSAPIAATITSGKAADNQASEGASNVTNITNQIVYGNLTSVSNSGHTSVVDSSTNKQIDFSENKLISEVHQALADSGVDGDELKKMQDALSALQSAKDKPSRWSAYNHFMAVCADHIGVITPFIEPLKNMFLGG